MLRSGEVVDGRYIVEARLGQGGLAEVYRVRHRELGSVHALKVLTWRRQSLADRMLLEGRIQAQLRHPHVVSVTDVIRHQGHVALLMEFVDGMTLEALLVQRGALPTDEGLRLFAPILAAVTAAHDVGVLHRDLKPANVLLARTSIGLIPKVTDFGIAKVVIEDQDHGKTAVGVLMGSPGYLAPEQIADSGSVDKRADVFALGVMLYEIISGERAYPDAVDESSARASVLTPPPLLSSVREDCPLHVCETVARALAPDPDDRFDDCRQMARALFADHPQLLEVVDRPQLSSAFSLQLTPVAVNETSANPTIVEPPIGGGAPTTPLSFEGTLGPPTAPTLPAQQRFAPLIIAALVGVILGGGALTYLMAAARPDPQPVVAAVTPSPSLEELPPAPTEAVIPTVEIINLDEAAPATPEEIAASAPEPDPGPAATPERLPDRMTQALASNEKPAANPVASDAVVPEPEPDPAPAADAMPMTGDAVAALSSPSTSPEPVGGAATDDAAQPADPPDPPDPPDSDPVEEISAEMSADAMVDAQPMSGPAGGGGSAPAAADDPEAEPEVSPAAAVVGVWSGEAGRLPMRMEIKDAGEGRISAVITLTVGPRPRSLVAFGRFNPDTQAISLRSEDGDFVFDGSLGSSRMSGAFTSGSRKAQPWSVSRG
ncbi:MAG: protein kinase [Myxococcota bacterium]